MNTDVDKKLWKYLFPVQEKKVFIEGEDGVAVLAPEYKSIVREDNGKLISVVQDSYKLIPNSGIIKPLVEQLHELDSQWYIDPTHSFVTDKNMRLQVTFTDLTFNDGKSEIALSLYVSNSYNMSSSINLIWGALRFVCGNGLLLGEVLAKIKRRHTSGLRLDNIVEQVHQTYDSIPVIKERISILQNIGVSKTLQESVEKQLGKNVAKYVQEQPSPESQWILYNYLTYYISHLVDMRMRAAYQMKVSKLFHL